METDGEDILFLIKRCIRLNIHVMDNALEHYEKEGKTCHQKMWKHSAKLSMRSLCYIF